MKSCTGFWVGMSAGLMAGAAVGMMVPCGRDPMKTQVGKSIPQLGVAVAHAVDNIVSEMRSRAGGGRMPSAFCQNVENKDRLSSLICYNNNDVASRQQTTVSAEKHWNSYGEVA